MLTAGEKRTLLILLPLWVVVCFIFALWLSFTKTVPVHAPTQAIKDEDGTTSTLEENERNAPTTPFAMYIEITGGCGSAYDAYCAAVYSAPDHTSTIVTQLRTGVILEVEDATTTPSGVWYKIVFNEWLRYPNRVTSEWYVPASDLVRVFIDNPTHVLNTEDIRPDHKYIVVDRSDQKLYAYENDELVMTQTISTGILATPTPRGTFTIYKKTPSRYMQGPIPGISTKQYDLPGVPWNLYFTEQGGVIHGAYWHDQFGKPWSNGCVNVPRGPAEELYHWADIGTTVFVRD